ncbi:hypothetical protein V8C37DRAFT_145627 [Trichoderma ceciliae]
MAILSATGRYKQIHHPSTTAKEAGPKNEARIKALGAPYDYQRLKKFNAQQALENPDWRTRPSDNSSSTADDDEQKIRGLIGAGKQWIRMDAPPTASSAVESKREDDAQQTMDTPQDGAMVNGGLERSQHDVFVLSSEMEPKIIKTLEEEKPVQYEVLKQICLSSSREHPLSLFEVVPLGSIPSCLSQSVVDIRPLRGNLPQRKHGAWGNGQDEQLTAALRAAETTPHKVRVHLNQRSHDEEARTNYAMPDELRVRRGFFESPEILAKRRSKAEVRTHEHQPPSTQTARLARNREPTAAAEAERDRAFQRFLKRLGQKNGQFGEEKTQKRDRVDSGYEDGSREHQGENLAEAASSRHRAQGPDRRKETTSDLRSDYSARSHKKEDTSKSADSGVFLNESAKFKNLNPKAREFLSFVSNPASGSEDGNMEPFQALSGGQATFTSLSGHGLPNVCSLQAPPPYGLMPLTAADGATDPLTLNRLMTGRLVPVPTDQFGGVLPASTISLPPLPSLLPAVLRPQSVLQSMTGNILGIPPAPPVLNSTAFPLAASSVNPCLSIPSCQIPLAAGAARPPQPVPKPRRPDPGDQQAYEAWIEWRKANEPGYALECRLRQQRRAQRSMTDKASTKAPPSQKSEASVST